MTVCLASLPFIHDDVPAPPKIYFLLIQFYCGKHRKLSQKQIIINCQIISCIQTRFLVYLTVTLREKNTLSKTVQNCGILQDHIRMGQSETSTSSQHEDSRCLHWS